MSSQLNFVDGDSFISKSNVVSCSRIKFALVVATVAAVGIGLGVIIGYFSHPSCVTCDGVCLGSDVPRKLVEDATEGITEQILAKMSAENIQRNLKYAQHLTLNNSLLDAETPTVSCRPRCTTQQGSDDDYWLVHALMLFPWSSLWHGRHGGPLNPEIGRAACGERV